MHQPRCHAVLCRNELPSVRSCSPEPGALQREDTFRILFYGGVTATEIVFDLNHVALAQRASIIDSCTCSDVKNLDVGTEFVFPLFLE